MKPSDPWAEIARPDTGFAARRIDPSHRGDLFWARDQLGRCAFLLQCSGVAGDIEPRPDLHGIEILEPPEDDGRRTLILILKARESAEIFQQLCLDLVDSSRDAADDAARLAAVIRRTWKWHQLLRGGASSRLGHEAQQGLIGELLVLEERLRRHPSQGVLASWRGPLDEPKDFVFGSHAIEVKARHVARNAVRISSEHQLQRQDGQSLALFVVSLSPADSTAPDAFNLDMIVARLQTALGGEPGALAVFDSRLGSAGYSIDHDYSDAWWVHLGARAFTVTDAFPRIEAAALPPGIEDVRYTLSIDACAPFEIPIDEALNPEAAR